MAYKLKRTEPGFHSARRQISAAYAFYFPFPPSVGKVFILPSTKYFNKYHDKREGLFGTQKFHRFRLVLQKKHLIKRIRIPNSLEYNDKLFMQKKTTNF